MADMRQFLVGKVPSGVAIKYGKLARVICVMQLISRASLTRARPPGNLGKNHLIRRSAPNEVVFQRFLSARLEAAKAHLAKTSAG